ncbi:MAG: hypothetical protein R3F59_22870 [Myxococcota bacterium]
MRLLLVPAALVGGGGLLSVVLLLVTLASGALEVRIAGNAAATDAAHLLTVLDGQHRLTVDRLEALGANVTVLDERMEAYLAQRGRVGQVPAALALVDAIDHESAFLLGDRTVSVDKMDLNHQIVTLRAARHTYDQALESWQHAAETWRGGAAVRLGLAYAPDENWLAPPTP